MRGKTLGFIGLGKIGRETARLLAPFGAVMQYGAPRHGLSRLAADSAGRARHAADGHGDIVVVLAALNAETRGLVDGDKLRLMKRTAILVNLSRGGIVDEAALIVTLRNKAIAGAAIDVFAIEPLPAESPLRTLPDLILPPHMATPTRPTIHRSRYARNLDRVLAGQPPRYVVNPAVLPAWTEKWGGRWYAPPARS